MIKRIDRGDVQIDNLELPGICPEVAPGQDIEQVAVVPAGPMGRSRRMRRSQARVKKIPLKPGAAAVIEKQLQAFRHKFGRDPGPDDPLFFDPDADTPVRINAEKGRAIWDKMCDVMEAQGLDPAMVYAARKTGRIVTDENIQLLTADEKQEWWDAVEEGRQRSSKH